MKTCNNLLILPLLMVVVLIHPINCSEHMTSFGYRLPSNSYAIFRLNHRTSIKNNEKKNNPWIPISRKSSSQEYFREKRHLTVSRKNPHRARKISTNTAGTSNPLKTFSSYEAHQRDDLQTSLTIRSDCEQLNQPLLDSVFPLCQTHLHACQMKDFGQCLLDYYPQTRDLTSSTMSRVTSANSFGASGINPARSLHEDDRICTDFVREFFARCRNYITSCQELKSDKIKALPVLGCLFSHYAELMLPLFNAKLREERFYYGSTKQYID